LAKAAPRHYEAVLNCACPEIERDHFTAQEISEPPNSGLFTDAEEIHPSLDVLATNSASPGKHAPSQNKEFDNIIRHFSFIAGK